MRILLWAEFQKLRRSNIILFTIFAAIFNQRFNVLIRGLIQLFSESDQLTANTVGWYMTITQVLATIFVLPSVIALLGSYMICREEQDDTIKSLRLIPINEARLTVAKMMVTFIFSVLVYLLLFMITFSAEAVLHFSDLSFGMILNFLKMYLLDGIGVFLAVAPIIALAPYLKKSYWLSLVLAEIYSFAGMFMSMSNMLKTFYPITAIFGVSGYYDTATQDWIYSFIVLLACGCLSVLLLNGLNHKKKG
ncbi:MAG: ABC transporter permease [[Clostridium] scindens]